MMQHAFLDAVRAVDLVTRTGRVRRIRSTYIEADGPNLPMGGLCEIETTAKGRASLAEVVGVNEDSIVLAPFDGAAATFSGARVTALAQSDGAPVGDAFLGRAVDALARPIDGGAAVAATAHGPLDGEVAAPMQRTSPKRVFETGVRAIDGLLTLARGQRVGIFAAAGVGKTTLMTQIARQVGVDRCVICLVGERGREVEAFWRGLPAQARARSTLVAATSDQSAAMRARAGRYALALAEHWRAQGHDVLLFIDSATRLAMALREIGLAAGEPPTIRAYTPSVFAALPRIVERCGAVAGGGSITAIMTVLSETNDIDDPIAEMMKSLLDGHILLSRDLAEQGRYPAIDVPRSISRLAGAVAEPAARAAAMKAVEALSTYESSRTLIETGMYVRGANADIDRALELRPALLDYLRQAEDERTPCLAAWERLASLIGART
ncbi:FliI/YscN family ATPase [Caulobacter radicis]|uniref:FliI/YscN family ATPase n=1 Tax=Caulobacter radicis TaxID=2172650 RepID=UPI000D56B11F|nr:FliI/YscN family ATPase [Caulobacter radicis]PVM84418.1 FliI/YscN family ATPase [Caulobacter radicis]